MEFRSIFIGIVVVGILFLAIFQLTITTQNQNNQAQLITNNTVINQSYGGLTTQLGTAQAGSDSASNTFGQITPTQSFGIVDVTSIVSPTRTFRALLIGTYNVMIVLPAKILGVPPIVVGVIGAILMLTIILGIWAIWRGVAG